MEKIIIPILTLAMLFVSCKGNSTDSETTQEVCVKTMRVEMQPTAVSHTYSGTVAATTSTALSFNAAGRIERILVTTGQRVAKGQLIATIDETSTRNAHAIAASTLRQAEDAYARLKRLHDAGSLPEIQWIEAESKVEQARSAEAIARKALEDCCLTAPFAGVIARKDAEAGQNVMPGVSVAELVTVDRVKARIAVPEKEIATITTGMEVSVRVSAVEGHIYKGVITEKGVVANPLSRSYEVSALIVNDGLRLMPGMLCEVSMMPRGETTAVILPTKIVQIDHENKAFVWTATDGKARKQTVVTGATTDRGIIITDGLAAGDVVIVEGQQKISEGMGLKMD